MIKKKKCPRCKKKIRKKYNYCPFCGISLEIEGDYGMLGKDDFSPINNEIKLPAGVNTLFNNLMKNFGKQFEDLNNEIKNTGNQKKDYGFNEKPIKKGISISINSLNGKSPIIQVKKLGPGKGEKIIQEKPKKTLPQLSEKKQKEISKFPREEPKTQIKRLPDKLICEIELPGVKSEKDISIKDLPESVEVKAIAKKKAYFKVFQMALEISKFKLEKEKLILEFKEE
jgi:HSP20 family molecular chaperone IbpA